MQVQTAARCAVRSLAFVVALVVALTAAFAPAANATPRAAGTSAAGEQDHRVALTHVAGWSAGPVTRWSGYSKTDGSRRVREVQRRLNRLGYQSGPVDGLFGPITDRAVHRFQIRHRLRVDGIVGSHTLRVLRAAGRPAEGRRNAPKRQPLTNPAPPASPAPHSSPAPQPAHVRQTAPRPSHQWPELPVTPLLVLLGALGVATVWRSYTRTCARVRHAQSEALAAIAGPAQRQSAVDDRPGRGRVHRGADPIGERDRGRGS